MLTSTRSLRHAPRAGRAGTVWRSTFDPGALVVLYDSAVRCDADAAARDAAIDEPQAKLSLAHKRTSRTGSNPRKVGAYYDNTAKGEPTVWEEVRVCVDVCVCGRVRVCRGRGMHACARAPRTKGSTN